MGSSMGAGLFSEDAGGGSNLISLGPAIHIHNTHPKPQGTDHPIISLHFSIHT